MKEYKVVKSNLAKEVQSLSNNWIYVLDCAECEADINKYAAEGWQLFSVLTPNDSKFGTTVLIFEREKA